MNNLQNNVPDNNDKKRFKLWLVGEGEPLPIDNKERLSRTGQMADYFSGKGYDVTWYSSTFMHVKKTYYCKGQKELTVSENEKLVLLHSSVSYRRNMSITRVVYHNVLAKELKKYLSEESVPVPDLIFCSYPTQQFCSVMIEYARKKHVPVIVDARDQWPDIFERAFPIPLRGLGTKLLGPMKKEAAHVFKSADAICAMSPVMVEWGLQYADRKKNNLDRAVFIGSKKKLYLDDMVGRALTQWLKLGISDRTWNICMFSGLSKTALDMDTLIDAVKLVHDTYPQIRLVIGGTGDDEERLREYSAGLDYVYMMGWLDQLQMSSLMSISKAGMLPYRNTKDFKDGWGNKVGQYLSYGLPLLTSAKGFSKTYVEQYGCGCAYEENNACDLAAVLERLISHPDEQQTLSQHAQERFAADFDYDVVEAQFEKMILDVHQDYIDKHRKG